MSAGKVKIAPAATVSPHNGVVDGDQSYQTMPRQITRGRSDSSASSMVTGNFSLPRSEKWNRLSKAKNIRPISHASSFKEAHGFSLSPSLLIPGDYQQQMAADRYDYHDEDIMGGPFHDEHSPSSYEASPLSYQQRSSTSTTESNLTSQTDTTGERHVSANSTFTAMTRLTVSSTSSTSLSKIASVISELEEEPLPVTQFADTKDDDLEDQEPTPPATSDTVPELTPFPAVNFARKPYHRPHASESVVVRDEVKPLKSPDATKTRRPRARTSSMSTRGGAPPPVGQYALFPRSNIKGIGDGI